MFGFPHARSLYRTIPGVNSERTAAADGPKTSANRLSVVPTRVPEGQPPAAHRRDAAAEPIEPPRKCAAHKGSVETAACRRCQSERVCMIEEFAAGTARSKFNIAATRISTERARTDRLRGSPHDPATHARDRKRPRSRVEERDPTVDRDTQSDHLLARMGKAVTPAH
jgi:hypothetical protein